MNSDEIRRKVRCGGRLGRRVNMMMLNYKAPWQFPTAGNVLTGENCRAVAILCDPCIEQAQGAIAEAVEFHGEQVVYHPVAELEPLPPEKTYRIVRASKDSGGGIHCLKCNRTSWNLQDVEKKQCPFCGPHDAA